MIPPIVQKRKNEKKLKKVQGREEKPESINTKPSDTNADITNRVFIMGNSIVKHIRGYELSQRVENCKLFWCKGEVHGGLHTAYTKRNA